MLQADHTFSFRHATQAVIFLLMSGSLRSPNAVRSAIADLLELPMTMLVISERLRDRRLKSAYVTSGLWHRTISQNEVLANMDPRE